MSPYELYSILLLMARLKHVHGDKTSTPHWMPVITKPVPRFPFYTGIAMWRNTIRKLSQVVGSNAGQAQKWSRFANMLKANMAVDQRQLFITEMPSRSAIWHRPLSMPKGGMKRICYVSNAGRVVKKFTRPLTFYGTLSEYESMWTLPETRSGQNTK